MDSLFTFLSKDYSGLLIGLALLMLGVIGLRRSGIVRRLSVIPALLGVLLSLGAASHLLRVSIVDNRFPPPGQMVDVDGFDMHVLAEGPEGAKGKGTVVWFPGGHAGGIGFLDLHQQLRAEARSVLVDRPGTGWSDTGPFPRTTAREVDEVLAALENAGEKPPYIFVGHSFGGLLAANIARRYPEKTTAVVLLDATPLDVIFYGRDKDGLRSLKKSEFYRGLRSIFGLYPWALPQPAFTQADTSNGYTSSLPAFEILKAIGIHSRTAFAGVSIYQELTPEGLIDRAWDTVVFDGALGDTPVYLVAPGEDQSTLAYAKGVVGDNPEAERFADFLTATRERYMQVSTNSTRVYTPAGTGHNFPYEKPQFVFETIRNVLADARRSKAEADEQYRQLTTEWPGPYGGVPPVHLATPEALETAYRRAIEDKRNEVRKISTNGEPATFANTVLALEASGLALHRVNALLSLFSSTASTPGYAGVAARVAALLPQLEDEIAHNSALFQRVETVHASLEQSDLSVEDRRLVEVIRAGMLRRGARLSVNGKNTLTQLNARLAELRTQFNQNVMADEAGLAVYTDSVQQLAGLNEQQIAAAKTVATQRERPEAWAIPIARPTVWPVLTQVHARELREQVWRAWSTRGGNSGANDNRPIIAEILRLRGEKARLLGYPSFAHYQTASRMAGTPETAMQVLMDTWAQVLEHTESELDELQALANVDLDGAVLQPWDRLYYAEKLRQQKFNFDAEAVKPYFELDNIVAAMFWAAGRVYGYDFRELEDIPVVSPDIRVFEVSRDGEVVGALWMDLFQRPGKGPASWASQYRSAADYDGKDLPLVALHSAVSPPNDKEPVLIEWGRANVIFHEFGHTLQTLSNRATYPSLGSLNVPWDFIEVPSLLNERWLMDRELLAKFAKHYQSGEPMPEALIERMVRAHNYDRVFSLTLNYLGGAIVDMKLHLLADGREIDAIAVQTETLEQLNMPQAVDLILYVPHAFHTFSENYAAGVYTYLWSDVIAADIAEAFLEAPGGLYDKSMAMRWRRELLDIANTMPIEQAYLNFRGRKPDGNALLRRFGLLPQSSNP